MGTTTTSRATQEQAAAQLGVTVKTLRTWEKKPWFPPSARNASGYDVETIRRRPRRTGSR